MPRFRVVNSGTSQFSIRPKSGGQGQGWAPGETKTVFVNDVDEADFRAQLTAASGQGITFTEANPDTGTGTERTWAGSGRNGAGAVTATGFAVGDTLISALNITDGTEDKAKFEATLTVANQIQQTAATDQSAKKYYFRVTAQS
jgi:hypothetical protein